MNESLPVAEGRGQLIFIIPVHLQLFYFGYVENSGLLASNRQFIFSVVDIGFKPDL